MNTEKLHQISLPEAVDMTTRYRANRPANFAICETFDKTAVAGLLATPGAASLRIYYGMDQGLLTHAILVAANAAGEDLLPPAVALTESGDDPVILEDGFRCPDDCPPPSPLNN